MYKSEITPIDYFRSLESLKSRMEHPGTVQALSSSHIFVDLCSRRVNLIVESFFPASQVVDHGQGLVANTNKYNYVYYINLTCLPLLSCRFVSFLSMQSWLMISSLMYSGGNPRQFTEQRTLSLSCS